MIGPKDDGRRMSLAEFEFAKVQEGYRYELSRGIIAEFDVPNPPSFFIEQEVREQLTIYKLSQPGVIDAIAGGSNCKLVVDEYESERHPDLAIYKTRPTARGRKVWRTWIPEIVIEIVTLGSALRDYEEKRVEYLSLGVKEYWIIDPTEEEMLMLRRRTGEWREMTLGATGTYETRLLPGFKLNLAKVFAAGRSV